MTNSELRDRLTNTIALLNVPGVGRVRFTRLSARLGSVETILAASISELESVPGISRTVASAIKQECDLDKARQIASRITQLGWAVMFQDSPDYPQPLVPLADAPPLLFREGDSFDPSDKMIGIVGTRHASESSRRFTRQLATELAREGITVVSGMAEGIDSEAHKGALEGGGRTIAVWGTPLNRVYPASNRQLAEKIRNQGAIYSEYLPDVESSPSNFPERNRIISGLSEGIIVVEAGRKSGALITAKYALEHGRELFAVPGPPGASRSIGTNALIKVGARLLTEVGDIFDELPRLKGQITAKKFRQMPDMTKQERQLVDLLAVGPLQLDNMSREAALPVSDLMELLLALELKGVVEELSGKRFVLREQ